MDGIAKHLEKLSRDDLLSLRKKVCALGASTDDRMLKNLLDTLEMQIIEITLVSYERFSENTIFNVLNALENKTR